MSKSSKSPVSRFNRSLRYAVPLLLLAIAGGYLAVRTDAAAVDAQPVAAERDPAIPASAKASELTADDLAAHMGVFSVALDCTFDPPQNGLWVQLIELKNGDVNPLTGTGSNGSVPMNPKQRVVFMYEYSIDRAKIVYTLDAGGTTIHGERANVLKGERVLHVGNPKMSEDGLCVIAYAMRPGADTVEPRDVDPRTAYHAIALYITSSPEKQIIGRINRAAPVSD